jgi:hypothetical protein
MRAPAGATALVAGLAGSPDSSGSLGSGERGRLIGTARREVDGQADEAGDGGNSKCLARPQRPRSGSGRRPARRPVPPSCAAVRRSSGRRPPPGRARRCRSSRRPWPRRLARPSAAWARRPGRRGAALMNLRLRLGPRPPGPQGLLQPSPLPATGRNVGEGSDRGRDDVSAAETLSRPWRGRTLAVHDWRCM